MDKYTHRERMELIFSGEKPDRFAASFWRHFFHKEHYAEGTAEAMLDFQKRFDWDFMKINPRADYHIEDWGFKQQYSHEEFKKHIKTDFPVESLDDWRNIEPLPLSSPALDEHLKAVSLIRKSLPRDFPILMTVFTPLAVAGRMVKDNDMLAGHIHKHPDKVLPAIEAITQTFEQFVVELRNAGADGIFYATTQWASSNLITWDEYLKFGVPFDLRVISQAGDDALNVFHVCSSNNYLKQLLELDYPCHMYNWDSNDPTNHPIDKGFELISDKPILGGVDHEGWLLHSSADEIRYKIDEIKDSFDPARLIIGPGCAIPPEVPMENLAAIRERL
ncbi:MAG: uroporphyrinogen decarboxylase family protein [candidate division Zixibacteria bacterium]